MGSLRENMFCSGRQSYTSLRSIRCTRNVTAQWLTLHVRAPKQSDTIYSSGPPHTDATISASRARLCRVGPMDMKRCRNHILASIDACCLANDIAVRIVPVPARQPNSISPAARGRLRQVQEVLCICNKLPPQSLQVTVCSCKRDAM